MNDDNFELADKYVAHNYVQQGKEARRTLEKNIRQLLEQGKIPIKGWNDMWIKHLLQEISLMDSNNFPDNCGVGEREARVANQLVAQRHFYLGHGIGRSGDIAEMQPKAAGSSLLAKLANSFALDVIRMQGVKSASSCLLVPVATGMALVLSMLTLKESRPKARYVIWPRIDQKSCFKSILTAGLEPLVVENLLVGDHLETDVSRIKTVITNVGNENILCVMTTTSCFAPRVPDKLEDVATICAEHSIPHIVNNAYGIQSTKCMHLIQQASRVGRLDAFIQSTDKNFMVPVGGAIIAGFDKELIQSIGKMYPGRASASPMIDFFITMLSLGQSGYTNLLKERKELYNSLKEGLVSLGEKYSERCMDVKANQISLAITLSQLHRESNGEKKNVTEFGSYLFKRSVSGTRVITPSDTKTIGRYTFHGWGAHHSNYPTAYLTAAAAIGTTTEDIDQFLKRLDKTFKLFIKDPTPLPQQSTDLDNVEVDDSHIDFSEPDLKPTRSLTERPKLMNHHAPKSRPQSFHALSSVSRYDEIEPGDREIVNRLLNENAAKYHSDTSLNDSSRESSMSRDTSYTRDDLAQQVILPSDIPPDKMTFLIDI